jgi:hypothetical protein
MMGCAAEVTDTGETTRIVFGSTVRTLVAAVPAAVILGGVVLALFRRTRAIGLAVALPWCVLSAIMVPTVLRDEVLVTGESVYQTTGFWFAPTRKGFRFDEVASVRVCDKPDRDGHMSMIWELHYRDGHVRDLDPGDLWEISSPEVVARLKRRGVQFE